MSETPEDVRSFVAEVITDDLPMSVWTPAELRTLCERYIVEWDRRRAAREGAEPKVQALTAQVEALKGALRVAQERFDQIDVAGFTQNEQSHTEILERCKALAADGSRRARAALIDTPAPQTGGMVRLDVGSFNQGVDAALTRALRIVEAGVGSLDGGVDAASRRYVADLRALLDTPPSDATDKADLLRKLVPGFRLDWSGLRNRFEDIASHLGTLTTYETRSDYLDELARDFEDAVAKALAASGAQQ